MERSRTPNESSFPHVSINASDGSRAAEVTLLTQLDVGAGDAVATAAGARQAQHAHFNDALDEPSARLSAPNLAAGDNAALYTFSVGSNGHPFHRHAAPRVFTAISGSGGARLRFIAAGSACDTPQDIQQALRHVEIPADCLFTVRMAANTWHQFEPLRDNGRHPALFAVSCHPDETAGALDPALQAQVARGEADLASLTELMPAALQQHTKQTEVWTSVLSFDPKPGQAWACAQLRQHAGQLRQLLVQLRPRSGTTSLRLPSLRVHGGHELPPDSLLAEQLPRYQHQDHVEVQIDQRWLASSHPEQLLAALLTAFIQQPAGSVSSLMRLRNLLARPLRLRTSSLGCPVSSLLSDAPTQRFAQRFPVLATSISANSAQVLLGADDRHLQFRSSVAVQRDGERITFSLSTRVYSRNPFGHLYMAAVDPMHRHFIAPKMLKTAVNCLLEEAATALPAGHVAFVTM